MEKKNKKKIEENNFMLGDKDFTCPVELTANAITGKWKLIIMHKLTIKEKLRYSELKKEITKITEKMLIQQLRELEKEELIERKIYPVVPPKVEYFLTQKGKGILPVIEALRTWGQLFKV